MIKQKKVMNNETGKTDEQNLIIQKLHDHVNALQQEDISWLEQNFLDSYIFINPSGTVPTKSETVALLKSGAIKLKAVDVDDEIANVYGEAAVASAVSTVNCFINDIDISGRYRYTYFFVKQHGKWRIVAEQGIRLLQQ